MRARVLMLVLLAAAACSESDNSPAGPIDARRDDGPVDAPPIDAPRDASTENGVPCESDAQVCDLPAQTCCLNAGADFCVGVGGPPCPGTTLQCDGPEDCGQFEDCCFFEGQGSRCVQDGFCGFTGAISEPMCHTVEDCFQTPFPSCCPSVMVTLPPLYRTCNFQSCP
jgi:hypothetical protein